LGIKPGFVFPAQHGIIQVTVALRYNFHGLQFKNPGPHGQGEVIAGLPERVFYIVQIVVAEAADSQGIFLSDDNSKKAIAVCQYPPVGM
jgi:hypothetical protein